MIWASCRRSLCRLCIFFLGTIFSGKVFTTLNSFTFGSSLPCQSLEAPAGMLERYLRAIILKLSMVDSILKPVPPGKCTECDDSCSHGATLMPPDLSQLLDCTFAIHVTAKSEATVGSEVCGASSAHILFRIASALTSSDIPSGPSSSACPGSWPAATRRAWWRVIPLRRWTRLPHCTP